MNKAQAIQDFDWAGEFPKCCNTDGCFEGFDVVIGNPPYVSSRHFKSRDQNLKAYYHDHFETAEYQLDLYQLFIEKACRIAKNNAQIAFVVPNTWLANHRSQKIRDFLLAHLAFSEIVYSHKTIFQQAGVDVMIFWGAKKTQNTKLTIKKIVGQKIKVVHQKPYHSFKENKGQIFDVFVTEADRQILKKIEQSSQCLGDCFRLTRGIHPYRRDGYGQSRYVPGVQTAKDYDNRSYHSDKKEDDTYRLELKGRHILPYRALESNSYLSYGRWLAEPRVPSFFEGDRIYARIILSSQGLVSALIPAGNDAVADQSIAVLKPKQKTLDLDYILALLNSKLATYYLRLKNNEFDSLFPKVKMYQLKNLPLRQGREKVAISRLVKQISKLVNSHLAEISALRPKIDQLLYSMYQLSEDEIAQIEKTV